MSDLKRLQNQLDQLEKSYKLGIISENEYNRGKENLEKKIEPLKEKQKKDTESKKIVDDILNQKKESKDKKITQDAKSTARDKEKDEETTKTQKNTITPEKGKEKTKAEDKKEKKKSDKSKEEKSKKKSETGDTQKETKKNTEKDTKKETTKNKKSTKTKKDKKKTKKSRFPKWLGFLLLLLVIFAFVSLTTTEEEEEDEKPFYRNLTGINDTVEISYYKSFSCNYCGETHKTLQKLKEIYNETITIKEVHYPYNIEQDFILDMALECSKEQNITDFSNKLYEIRKPVEKSDLVGIFEGNETLFEDCLKNNKTAEKVLEDYKKSIEKEIESVPTVEINGATITGNRRIELYMTIIDRELGIEPDLQE